MLFTRQCFHKIIHQLQIGTGMERFLGNMRKIEYPLFIVPELTNT